MQEKNRIYRARKALDNIVNRLEQDYDPEQIILFGSYAYGNPTEESDLDLLIVKDTAEPVLARWTRVRKLVSDLRKGIAFSPVIITPSELKNRLEKRDPFFEEIIRRGKKLYVRQGIKPA
ncbi:putative nucleotidyltransferase [Candidatus Methanoperedens nitroreducens]|uniref:Putative nucleotidyltransferase n=1 Tax=Candidatus Methanoperedens nitratireducens TaxID=1392998 RepID=A0A062V0F9_9EURY|nr:nucleotidyltransferase domain-containing protein [Candidatus Methanoperedens nitroreducens]KCZ70862.1 putative nucleotidyltransferase [Candidatus Methanoperedens nitroreducens]MDJ1420717.1 nucleotidyltransferase domain-containing protein [Candidatus Methanoperedens sp.]